MIKSASARNGFYIAPSIVGFVPLHENRATSYSSASFLPNISRARRGLIKSGTSSVGLEK